MKFAVGQKLIAVTFRHYQGEERIEEVEITKVGVKWLYAGHMRIGRKSLAIDGAEYISPGRCYLSREHHLRSAVADKLWQHLRQKMTWERPPEVMPDAVTEAMKLLQIEGLPPAKKGDQ